MKAYSELKAAWHLDRVEALRQKKQIVPSQVQLVISDLCNHDCSFCGYRMSNGVSSELFVVRDGDKVDRNPNRMLTTEKAKEIISDCSSLGVKCIQFTGGGEPTVHKDHLELFRYVNEMGMQSALISNGYLLRDGWEDVYRRMTWIRISLDAGSPESYSSIRGLRISAYQRTLDNIQKIVEATRDTPCLVGAGFVLTRENYRELESACHAVKNAGVKYLRIAAVFSKNGAGYYDGIEDEAKEIVQRAKKKYGDESFEIFDIFTNRVDDYAEGPPTYSFCGYQFFNLYIGADHNVYRCCTTSYTPRGILGSIAERSFAEWYSDPETYNKFFDFDARGCPLCQFNDKNEVINYLVGEEPTHVNFV